MSETGNSDGIQGPAAVLLTCELRSSRVGNRSPQRVRRKLNRRRPRYVRGSLGKTMRLGRVGPGGEYAGIHVGAQLRSRKRRTEYYVGVSAGRKIATPH